MGNRVRGAVCGALICVVAYAVIGFAISATLGSEVVSGAMFFVVMSSPIPLIVGAIGGGLLAGKPLRNWFLKLVTIGIATPLTVFLIVLMAHGIKDSSEAAESAKLRESAIANAKTLGFQFPPDALPGISGQLWSREPLTSVDGFYQASSLQEWNRIKVGSHIWYVRFRGSICDRIVLMREYETTSIYFESMDNEKLKLEVGAAFLSGVQAGDWNLVKTFSELPPAKLKSTFKDVEVSSSTFDRDTNVGANVKRELRNGFFQSGEVLLKLSEDQMPKVLKVQLPEGW